MSIRKVLTRELVEIDWEPTPPPNQDNGESEENEQKEKSSEKWPPAQQSKPNSPKEKNQWKIGEIVKNNETGEHAKIVKVNADGTVEVGSPLTPEELKQNKIKIRG